jgi:acyl-CoA synthetase (NDP forming)
MNFDFGPLFSPRSVAVVGASDNEGKLGFHVMKSLVQGEFQGRIFPINPGRGTVLGMPAFPSLEQTPEPVDVAVLVLPAPLVPEQIQMCARRSVRGVILISAGFREIEDPAGGRLEEEVARLATEAGIPVIGPNTFGLINLPHRFNGSFTPEFSRLRPGGVTLVSQSGGMSHLLGFLAMRNDVGFSKIVGLGNRCNVDFADLLGWLLEEDDSTAAVALYVEGMDDPRTLLDRLGRASRSKPVVVYKCGSAAGGDRASRSHTGSMAGRHEVYRGAFHQAGVLTVSSAEELLDAVRALALCPPLENGRIAVLSGQAGPAMAACDVCEEVGLRVNPFSESTQESIDELLPPLALRTNPVDMGPAWYDPDAIRGILRAVLEDPQVSGILLLIVFASANAAAPGALAGLLKEWNQRKPVLGCLSAPPSIWEEEIRALESAGALVNYPSPERAARALGQLWRWKQVHDRVAGSEAGT